MTKPRLDFKPTVTYGNIIEMVVILTVAIMAFTSVRSDVEAVKEDQQEIKQEFREYQQFVRHTYVRKDVFDQILIRLESIDDKVNEK